MGASVTSAVGFGAFAVSELIPLRHFGLASAAAILYTYPLIVGALWGGLWLAPSLRAAPRPRFAWAKLAAAAQQLTAAHAGRVAVAALLGTALLGGGLAHLRTETNFLTVFFADDSRVRRAFDLVDAQLGGSGRVEVAMRGGADAFATAAALAQVKRAANRAAAVDTVNHVDSYLLPVAMAHAAFAEPRGGDGRGGESDGDGDGDGDSNSDIGDAGAGDDAALPVTDAEVAQELLFLSLSRGETRRDVLSPYLNFDHSAARLSLQTPNLDSAALQRTLDAAAAAVDSAVAAATGPTTVTNTGPATVTDAGPDSADTGPATDTSPATSNATVTLTGLNVFIHHLGQLVLRTQAFSILLTLAAIGALLLMQFGARAGLCGLAANLLPLAATAGLVAWLGHPYDFAAILIAGVTLGLSVDDT
ncbi:MAG: hypothetical protein OXE47_07365, partial [Gammaproteobacteria bacterium]|nr:hypothetical protein [Gammaproteobacteria bacterium]